MSLLEYLSADRGAFLAVSGVVGLLIGSFLNVVIARLPEMMLRAWRQECAEFLAEDGHETGPETSPSAEAPDERFNLCTPGSRCPSCSRPIRAIENIPVVSYLVLRGRCACRRQRISLRYPAVELLTGGLSLLVAWHFGFGWAALAALALLWALIALTFIDVDHQLLPDSITLPFLWVGLGVNYFALFCPLEDAVVGAMLGYGVLFTVYHLFKLLTGKEGMGHGDFKLLALLGAWLGWQMLPAIILLSSVVGAVFGIVSILVRRMDRSMPMPFGPFLAVAGLVCLLWGETINSFYL